MAALITEQIQTPSGQEVVTQALGALLALELQNQYDLAVSGGTEDPNDWLSRVYSNRVGPWDITDARVAEPINTDVNVWWSDNTEDKQGSTVRSERGEGTWNIDIYAYGRARATQGGGHTPADIDAKNRLDRWVGIVRQVLMSEQYVVLGSPFGANQWCYGRWITGAKTFQPELDANMAVAAVGGRLSLEVKFLLTAPAHLGDVFELLSTCVYRQGDGRLLAKLTSAKSGNFQAGFDNIFD
jgi:hypothetical protein